MSFGILLFSVWLFDQCFDIPQASEFILLSVFLFICVFGVQCFSSTQRGEKKSDNQRITHVSKYITWHCVLTEAVGQELICYSGLPALTYYWIKSICIGVEPIIKSCLSTYSFLYGLGCIGMFHKHTFHKYRLMDMYKCFLTVPAI